MTPIMTALSQGYFKSAKILAKEGADLSIKDNNDQTIIHLAASQNKVQVIESILKDDVNPELKLEINPDKKPKIDDNDQFENTPLHLACSNGHRDTVKVLLTLGAEIERKNEDEMTPFLLAAENGHADVVDHLLTLFEKEKHLLNDSDGGGNSALHLAATKNLTKTVEVLLKRKADFRRRNVIGWTPLDCAAANGSYKCVLRILEAGAEVDSMDQRQYEHNTPLHLTAIKGHANVTKLLLERGAKVTLTNHDDKNALELAIEHSNISVAKAILDSHCWRKAMSGLRFKDDGHTPITPMRMLIRKSPTLATMVLDRCITPEGDDSDEDEEEDKKARRKRTKPSNDQNQNNNDGHIDVEKSKEKEKEKQAAKQKFKFDFAFLEDSFLKIENKRPKKLGQLERLQKFGRGLRSGSHEDQEEEEDEDLARNRRWLRERDLYNHHNHPLMIMSKHQQVLLKHPLCLALLRHKWKRFRTWFLFYNLFYFLFLAFITSYVLMDHDLLSGSADTMNSLRYGTFVLIVIGLGLDAIDAWKVHKISETSSPCYFCFFQTGWSYLKSLDDWLDVAIYGMALSYIILFYGFHREDDVS